jgi:hypothetical protein
VNLDNDQEEFPVLKAELEAEFPYGVLLITDAESTEQIPSWDSPEEPVASPPVHWSSAAGTRTTAK